ncbi:hypothetical protein NPX13_g3313 [Xylaria arbuscula]|uniref:Uncharacterized protein n=1 Tax=Xylaria arbuscula TaxID=114810 RepID=A0A9W8NIG1_9PEZI|nr:hypothetical protein NPX13_g3313 [Xylaria arbuscula]
MTQIEFPLSDEDVHCGSSTRSFSVASTGNSVSSPYTPTSGRSTPSLSLSMMMNQATMECEGLNLAVTPSQTVYGTSVSPTSAEPPHYLGMTYPQYMPHLATPPSEDIPQPQFPTDGYNQYDSMTTAWACPMDSQTLFEERGLSQGNPFMGDGGFPAPFLSVQERSAALHQVQLFMSGKNCARANSVALSSIETTTSDLTLNYILHKVKDEQHTTQKLCWSISKKWPKQSRGNDGMANWRREETNNGGCQRIAPLSSMAET